MSAMSECCQADAEGAAGAGGGRPGTDGGGRSGKKPRLPAALWAAGAALILAGLFIFDVDVSPSGRFQSLLGREAKPTARPDSELTAAGLAAAVVPEEGYTVEVKWGDTGRELVAAGGIDLEKYRANYSDEKYEELLTYLTEDKNKGITITQDNAYFWVNTLWALGLTQKSDVLDKGVMGTKYKERLGNFASTGGWTLGARPAVELYSSADIIPLSAERQRLVEKISANVYRPCCGNSTAFPDCNHGMAALGLIELMAAQGFEEEEIYEAALAFNSYWFTQTYVDLAYYFEKEKGISWADVDAREVLGSRYSSAQGYRQIKQAMEPVPGQRSSGASCGA